MEIKDYLKIQSKVNYCLFLMVYFLLYPLAKLLYGRKKNWIICERGSDAQDNGFVFFKYLTEKHPEIHSTYIISSKSVDYDKVKKFGRTVEWCSLKHFLMTIGCPVKISSHLFGYAPWTSMATYFRRNKTHDKHIFLQHGIIKNLHEGLFGNVCKSLDLFVCSAKPEYDFIVEQFKYNNEVPQYTGLARYDLLNNYDTDNQVLIIPTWRAELADLSDEEFSNTKFYLNWQSIIDSKEIINICLKKNIVIKFYLHQSLQKFSSLFKGYDVVKIIRFGEENVQKLLKESKLLITDFSSVYFDFAYMSKPLLYFQFDEDTFYDRHYTKGYFDYRRDGFGLVCIEQSSLIKEAVNIINSGFILNKTYKERSERFFVFRDSSNCQRIFDLIEKLQNS